MKCSEIIEKSISMKPKNVSKSSSNRTIGFEFEIEYQLTDDEIQEIYDRIRNYEYPFEQFFNNTFKTEKKFIDEYFETKADFNYATKQDYIKDLKDKNSNSNDIDEKLKTHVIDKNSNVLSIEEISFNDIPKFVKNHSEIQEDILEKYKHSIEIRASSEIERIYKELKNNNGFENITKILEKHIGIKPENNGDSTSEWSITNDESVPYGFELITPPFDNIDKGLKELTNVLKMISDEKRFTTTKKTGLHVNIGVNDVDNIDLLKFMLIVGESFIIKLFDRENNIHTRSLLNELQLFLYDNSNNYPSMAYDKIIKSLNNKILNMNTKNFFINVNNLKDENYIEIRALGGKNYENKESYIINTIKRIIYAIDIAENPELFKKEYLSKLGKFIHKETHGEKKYTDKRGPFTPKEVKRLKDYLINETNIIDENEDVVSKLLESNNKIFTILETIAKKNYFFPDDVASIFYKAFYYMKNKLSYNMTKNLANMAYHFAEVNEHKSVITFIENIKDNLS